MRCLSPALILTAALGLVVAGCGDSDDGAATTVPPPTTAAPTTTQAPPTTAAPTTTTTLPPTTVAPTTTEPTTTTSGDFFAAAQATLDRVLEQCNAYLADLGDEPAFGSPGDPTAGGRFTDEVSPGVFEFVDVDGVVLLVDTNGGVVTGPDGPEGVAPRPYSFWCPHEVLPGTLDEGDPDAVGPVVLEPRGLGVASFGAEPEATIADLTAALGLPDEDSGWIDSFSGFGTCPGSEVRVVRWDELEVYFTDLTTAYGDYPDPGGPHFFSWLAATFVDEEPPAYGFATAEGVAPGSPVSFVREAYGEDRVEIAYEEAFDIWFLDIGGELGGTVSGQSPNDLVTSLQAGFGCGE